VEGLSAEPRASPAAEVEAEAIRDAPEAPSRESLSSDPLSQALIAESTRVDIAGARKKATIRLFN
jgi:hypothetical protein